MTVTESAVMMALSFGARPAVARHGRRLMTRTCSARHEGDSDGIVGMSLRDGRRERGGFCQ